MSKLKAEAEDSAAVEAECSEHKEPWKATFVPPTSSARVLVWTTLFALLLVDVLFLAADVAHTLGEGTERGVLGIFAPEAWAGDDDGSHLEVWGHIQMVAASVILLVLSVSHRIFVFFAWALLLIVIVVDDLFQVHEKVGEYFVEVLNLQSALGLRAEDFGELLTWASLGLLVLLPLAVGHWRAGAWARRQSWSFVAILALLAVFAIGLHLLAIVVQGHVSEQVLQVVALGETAGEIIPMSLFLAFTIKLAIMPGQALLKPRVR